MEKKLNVRKIFIFILLIVLIIILFSSLFQNILEHFHSNISTGKQYSNQQALSKYEIIAQDNNKNYSGVGKKSVKNKDGYFSTFTTKDKNKKTYIDYKQNGNSSWSNNKYWDGNMADNGCGITAMATILSGYNKNYTPESLRKKYYPALDGTQISKELSETFGINNTDFYYDSVHLSKENIQNHLETNRPVLICVWNKPTENRWTTASHYMVLLATDGQGMVYVANPNGLENTSKSSGWYDFDEIQPYIAKALYVESYN